MADETTPEETTEAAAAAEETPAVEAAPSEPVADEAPAADAAAEEAPAVVAEAAAADDAPVELTVDEAAQAAEAATAQLEKDFEAAKAKLLKPAKDARYYATGKRKTAVARVILTPGKGTFWINGREMKEYFPRQSLQTQVMEPFELTGAGGSYHVRARIHGGGVSAQAHALQHGIAKAMAEVDQSIRTQLKGKGLLKVDTRQVERKKAGFKKARKKPQFSKR